MSRFWSWLACAVLPSISLLAAGTVLSTPGVADEVKIVTVMDNEVIDPGLKTGWGFSAAVLTPRGNLLFDTGPDGPALLSNLAALGLQPAQFGKLMISHSDRDHAAGIPAFVAAAPGVDVYLPGEALSIVKETGATGATVHNVMAPGEMAPGLLTTGPMDLKQEQALLIETRDGLVLMTGCAHPGIVEVVTEAERLHPGKRMLLVMGGFHLFRSADSKVDAVVAALKALKVEKVAPSHCSGGYARQRFMEAYGPDYIAGGVGLNITFPAP